MILDVSPLLSGQVKTLDFDFALEGKEVSSDITCGKIMVAGQVKDHSGFLTAEYKITLDASALCARCGKEFSLSGTKKSLLKLTDKLENEDNDEFYLFHNGTVDLGEVVRTGIILDMPAKFLCKEDCRGLCEKCGADLNQGDCSCDKRDLDPRWSVLSDFFKE